VKVLKVSFADLTRSGLWVALYVLLALYPLLWLAAVPTPRGGNFQEELGGALGFLALSMMAMQFLLTARFAWLAPPFGTDLVYAFHRHVTAAMVAFAVLHPVLLLGWDLSAWWSFLLPWEAPWSIGAGVVSLYALLVVAITSWWRRKLQLPYDFWRRAHGVLALLAVSLGLWHGVVAERLLAAPIIRWLWLGWTLSWAALLLRVRLVKPAALMRRPYVVQEIRPEPGDAVTLVMDPHRHEGFRFRSGQFAWLSLGSSPFSAAEHPFSFAGSSQRAPRIEMLIKAAGDFTRTLAERTRPGDRCYVDGPFGTMSIDAFPDADGYVFVAGGVGLAPCLSMLRTLADRGDRRPHVIVYATVEWDKTPHVETLKGLQSKLSLRVHHVVERPPPGWTGEAGFVTEAMLERLVPRDGRRACFICGPPRMMDVVETALARLGVPLGQIHSERFDLV
jgi:predicted ferric reductase